MDAHLTKLTGPTFHFYKDGEKVKEHVGDTYPALEVRPLLSLRCARPER